MLINDFWQAIRPAIVIDKSKGYFDMPLLGGFIGGVFAQNTPQIFNQWNFTSATNFTLKFPMTAPALDPLCAPYLLCIRYIANGRVYRYKLWTQAGDAKIFAPLYTGQPIAKNFCVELWSVTVGTDGMGNNNGGDNVIPMGTIYSAAGGYYFPTVKDGGQYYYHDFNDDGATYEIKNNNVTIPNGSIFIANQNTNLNTNSGCVFLGQNSKPIAGILKYAPDQLFYFPTVGQSFRIYTSQLKTKSSFTESGTYVSIPVGTFCLYAVGAEQSQNLNNYPIAGGGSGSFPIHFNTCISSATN